MNKSAQAPSFRPLYEQIKILLTQSLVAGEWKPGEAIPSEMELAARFRVSQGTVRKAIDELASENILMRRQGKGTYVASHTEPEYQYRFLRVTPDSGEKTPPKNLFFGLERGKAHGDAARALGLKPGAPVMGFKRVMSFGGRPMILDDIVFAAQPLSGTHARGARGIRRFGLQLLRDRLRRAHGARRGTVARGGRRRIRRGAPQGRAADAAACASIAWPTRTETTRWNGAGACAAPTDSRITTS